jgi:uncharacterized protein
MPIRIRDPIHNFIVLPDDMLSLINTKALQRLRGIRQLALANLVYPGALHTRFDHTLGVAHVAGLMADKLELKCDEKRLVQLTALLHDVGHGPFSHVSEASLSRFADQSALDEGQNQDRIHELVTAEIIRTDAEICSILDEQTRDQVVRLLQDGFGRPVLKQIVSGPLDADKQDYLLRDSRYCGVEYGVFDLHQLHRTLMCHETDDEGLVVEEDGIHAVEQFVLAKYYMTANVYRHRVRLVTDQMIGRAIVLGMEHDKLDEMNQLYRFKKGPEFIRNYQGWDDARFMETFCPADRSAPGAKSGDLLRRLRERRLLKRVFSERIEKYNPPRIREIVKELPKPVRDGIRGDIEKETAEFLSRELSVRVDPDQVIVYAFAIKSVRESSKNDDAEGILVMDGAVPKAFTEQSTLFKSINEAYSDTFVEIYAPITWPSTDKSALRDKWIVPLREIIEKHCKQLARQKVTKESASSKAPMDLEGLET